EILSLYNNTIKQLDEHAFDGLGHLRLLYMDENQIEKLPEGLFSGLEELQILELQHNRIKEIGDDQFVLCPMLRELNLSANMVSTFNMTQLASLNKLETLDIARNYLDEVFITKYVRTLNAQENQISRIVMDQGDFFQLTHLNLSRNNIANINNIFKLRNLIELDVSYNELVTLDFVIFAFMKNLKDIKLNNNRLWILDNGIPSPAKSLRSLNLAHNKFLYLDLAVLETFPALEYIYLHGNDLIDMTLEEIEQHFPYLTLVSCDNNDWDCINLMHIVTLLERAYIKWSNGNRNCTRPEQHRLICCTTAEHHLREKIVRLTREIYRSRKMIKQLIMENAELRSEVEMQYLPGDVRRGHGSPAPLDRPAGQFSLNHCHGRRVCHVRRPGRRIRTLPVRRFPSEWCRVTMVTREGGGVLWLAVFALKLSLGPAGAEIVICNYEQFQLFDSMYRPRTDHFCVFSDVYLGQDVRGADFLASSLDYKRVAFTNSKFAQVPPSLFKNFDDIRELYVRRCSVETLKVTRQLEKVFAGSNRIVSVQLDGNSSNSLRELYLDGNRLRGLSNLTHLPNLEVLVLENNPLLGDVDFAQFARMEHLWKLDLERIGMRTVRNGLQRPLEALRRLDLSNNELTYVHVRMFRTFPRLEHLWLHGNQLYFLEADQLPAAMPAVRSIVIDDNYWGCGHLAVLGKQLRDRGIIIRHGECRTRAVHRVCCSDVTDVVDFRYIIEMGIRREERLVQDMSELRTVAGLLRQDLEQLRHQLAAMNLTEPAVEVTTSQESAESSGLSVSAEEDYEDEDDRKGIFYFPIVQSGSIPASMAPLGIFLLSIFLAGSPTVVECQYGSAGRYQQPQPAQTDYAAWYQRYFCMESTENYDCIFKNVHTARPYQSSAPSYAFGSGNVSSTHLKLAFRDSTLRFLPKALLDSFPYVEVLNLESLQMDSIEQRAFRQGLHLRELFMNHNHLTALDAGVFNHLSSLQMLVMDRNELAQLPAGVFDYLANLTVLSMSNNKLLRIEDATFQYVRALEYLNVSSNQIEYFNPSRIVNASDIDVSFNLLTQLEIPARLTSLYAQNNRIQTILGQSGMLEELQLSHNNLSGLEWLPRFPGLHQLDVSHNELEEVKAIHFKGLKKLQTLLLNNNRLFTLDVNSDSLQKLKVLDLSHNQLVYVLKNGPLFSKLQELYLHHNAIVSLKLTAGHGIRNISLTRNDWDCKNLRELLPVLSDTTVSADEEGYCKPQYISEHVQGVQICCKESNAPYLDRLMEQIRLTSVFEKNTRTNNRCTVESGL
ncbi:uncharacterized protein LOC128276270, partial [Anopheles cruzii]|uniref:uncharacterized protein LOC128276270 n=1 Tax=Anopheles cruzii TaxID=68878 RepID=UPI0022EC67DB